LSSSEDEARAAPATVSGESAPDYGHWETGKAGRMDGDPRARRPAGTVTQPVGGEHHTERSNAAVTSFPMREREAASGRARSARDRGSVGRVVPARQA